MILKKSISLIRKVSFISLKLINIFFNFNLAYPAGSSSSDGGKVDLYKAGKKLVLRAKKLEKKETGKNWKNEKQKKTDIFVF